VRNEGNACQRSLLPCHRLANFFSHKKLIIQIYLKMFKLANEREKDIYRIFTPCSTTRFLFSREIKYIIEECRWSHLKHTWRELTAPAATAREREIFGDTPQYEKKSHTRDIGQ
jgi:hypothetical protein